MRGSHIKLGEGERKVRLGQDSLPNKVETSGDYVRCFTRSLDLILQVYMHIFEYLNSVFEKFNILISIGFLNISILFSKIQYFNFNWYNVYNNWRY